ncbi:MAG: hypothetical protein JWO11_3882 [Nocardioides sp.]|nr:hypothetical protein [Nocardioides sp.]
MAAISRGLYVYNGPVLTVAGSPLLSAWLDVSGYGRVLPWFVFAAGTSTHSIEGSWDGTAADADFAYTAPTSGTEFNVVSPFIRWRTVQTVADATKSKVYLVARL